MAKYTLEVTEEQLQLIRMSLEEYFRIRMGQFDMMAEDLAFVGFDYADHTDEDFRRRIDLRDEIRDMNAYMLRKVPADLTSLKTDEINNLIDMWHVIRHQEWKDHPSSGWDVRSSEPFQGGTEPMMTIRKEE